MSIDIEKIIKTVGLYIVQVGALWGLLEGYTYFQGDALKDGLGSFWVLIYILPIFTTWYIRHSEPSQQKTYEQITTKGQYSPGKVGGNYSVNSVTNSETPSSTENTGQTGDGEVQVADETDVTKKISTEGDYSPGEVGGDYNVRL